MNRRVIVFFCVLPTVLLLTICSQAQQLAKIPRIGFLTNNSSTGLAAADEAFRQGLRALGYVEGKSLVIEYRYGEGKVGRLAEMAAELVRLKVGVIVTGGPTSTRTAKQATSTIPIVMASDPDPVANGFVASLARPGGNITGLATLSPELSGKRLELLKEILPKLSRVAVLGTSTTPGTAQELKEAELAAGAFGVKLQYLNVLDPKDIEAGFRAASKERADAVLVLNSAILLSQRTQVVNLAAKSRLPAIYPQSEYVEDGGAYHLRRELDRLTPARCYLRGQDSEGSQACRSACGATDEVRAGDQLENRQADWSYGSTKSARAGGQSH
jgi:putative ABC transport system substrate-binding protein